MPDKDKRITASDKVKEIDGLEARVNEASRLIGDRKSVAKAMGISSAQLYRYLRGYGVPTLVSLIGLSNRSGLSLEWLATGRGAKVKAESGVKPHDLNSDEIEFLRRQIEHYRSYTGSLERQIAGLQKQIEELLVLLRLGRAEDDIKSAERVDASQARGPNRPGE